jgi:hypothetical protein
VCAPRAAADAGSFRLWDADTAVREITAVLDAYPQIRDVHSWAQFPGESVESGSERAAYIAEKVLPPVRAHQSSSAVPMVAGTAELERTGE